MGELIPRDWVLKNLLFDVDRDVVRAAPVVDAEPVRHGRVKCDFCGRGKPIKAYTYRPDCGLQYGATIEAVYCPKCGAKMDGEAE